MREPSGRRLSADGRRQHEVDASTRRSAPRAPSRPTTLTWLEEPIIPDDLGRPCPRRARGRPADRGGREPAHACGTSSTYIAAGGVTYPEPDVTNCGGVTPFMKIAHLAEAFNLPVTSHGAHDVTVHLLAAVPEPLLPRGARLRSRPLHRGALEDRGWLCHRARSAGPWHRVRLVQGSTAIRA